MVTLLHCGLMTASINHLQGQHNKQAKFEQLLIYHSWSAGQVSSRISTPLGPRRGRLHTSVHSAPQGSALCSTSWTGESHREAHCCLPSSPVWESPHRETCPESECRSGPVGEAGRGRGRSRSGWFHWCKCAARLALDWTMWCRWSTTGFVPTWSSRAPSLLTTTHPNLSMFPEVPARCFLPLVPCR